MIVNESERAYALITVGGPPPALIITPLLFINYKDFNKHLKYDYQTKDIKEFYLKKLKKYKNKIHFMRQNAHYETDFFKIVGEFKDTYINKWKINQNKTFLFDLLANYKRKKI